MKICKITPIIIIQTPKQYFSFTLDSVVPMFTCHCWIPWRSHVMAFYYTLCFSIHQPTLYFACIFLFICRCELWPACFHPPITLVCVMFLHHCCFLQMVHNVVIIIINVYLLCPMIAAPFLPNISIRWSWSESQIGVWKKEENSHAFI